jgi:eukaryotic-like serine/threonine-protein kinase
MATVAYVAPELVTDGRADPRSDVYSAGIVLFEMLTGRVPFDGGNPSEVAYQHVDQDVPPPSWQVRGLPPAVDELVVRATRRDPAARPTDAGAFLNDLQAVRERVAAGQVAGAPDRAAATVVMPAIPSTDRPSWARLPSTRTPGPHRGGTLVASTGRRPPGSAGGLTPEQRRRVIGAAIIGALVLLVAVGGWWFGIGRWKPAPDLVGLARDEAVALAQAEGLQVEFAEEQYDNEVPAGHVLAQDPTGRVVRGGTIELTLSRGPEVFGVPDVVGATLEVATRQLEDLGLVVVEGDGGYSNTVPEGRVLSVDPEVGTEVRPGAEITVNVSQGRAPITVPSLIGQNVNAATAQLQGLGLEPVVEQVDSNEPAGQVINQDPAAGGGAEPGDQVRLEVSRGPPVTPVPNVLGQPCAQATQALQQAGFQVVQGFPGAQGAVQLQNPGEGTGLPPGSSVTIWCAP